MDFVCFVVVLFVNWVSNLDVWIDLNMIFEICKRIEIEFGEEMFRKICFV